MTSYKFAHVHFLSASLHAQCKYLPTLITSEKGTNQKNFVLYSWISYTSDYFFCKNKDTWCTRQYSGVPLYPGVCVVSPPCVRQRYMYFQNGQKKKVLTKSCLEIFGGPDMTAHVQGGSHCSLIVEHIAENRSDLLGFKCFQRLLSMQFIHRKSFWKFYGAFYKDILHF